MTAIKLLHLSNMLASEREQGYRQVGKDFPVFIQPERKTGAGYHGFSFDTSRVWKETEAALRGPDPQVFFAILRECGALAVVYPEIDGLFGVPQPARWHPEIDCGIHTLNWRLEARLSIVARTRARIPAPVHRGISRRLRSETSL